MSCIIEFSREAAADIDALYKAHRRLFARVINKIESLHANPRGGKPLAGNHKGEFPLRVGDYRIVYEVALHTVYILTVKHLKHAY